MAEAPILYQWDGEAMIPAAQHWARQADRQFVVGERYRMVEHHDRSANSHRHFFACIHDAWQNLPDRMLEQYPTSEHLRKKALIWKGYRDERSIVCASAAEAQRVAAFVKPMDDFAVVTVKDAVVRVWTAKSQSVKAMGRKEFQDSKSDVLDFVDDLLGVERGDTARTGRDAA
ncbi:hypothetical protein GN330_16660 [Nitratireductor sp. CAU 1489]|uniref:Uncharacterized protein n=1 Tax=Nitratireductor arenosus TaxID=2682096 RepID=A0A844QLX5_9HYPH|nr:hypothetical protein [Nitratireductor arenosus]MVA98881.1 hypothetical protein [Nitratireductor arenosus]